MASTIGHGQARGIRREHKCLREKWVNAQIYHVMGAHCACPYRAVGEEQAAHQNDRRQAALLPPRPGRDVTIRACSSYYGLNTVTNQRLDPQEWTDIVQTMSAKGVAATHADRIGFGLISVRPFREPAMRNKDL